MNWSKEDTHDPMGPGSSSIYKLMSQRTKFFKFPHCSVVLNRSSSEIGKDGNFGRKQRHYMGFKSSPRINPHCVQQLHPWQIAVNGSLSSPLREGLHVFPSMEVPSAKITSGMYTQKWNPHNWPGERTYWGASLYSFTESKMTLLPSPYMIKLRHHEYQQDLCRSPHIVGGFKAPMSASQSSHHSILTGKQGHTTVGALAIWSLQPKEIIMSLITSEVIVVTDTPLDYWDSNPFLRTLSHSLQLAFISTARVPRLTIPDCQQRELLQQ